MKRRIISQPTPCKQRPPRLAKKHIYPFWEGPSLLLSYRTDFALKVTLSGRRGAKHNAISIVSVVVIVVAVGIDIPEITGIVGISGTQPPIVRGAKTDFTDWNLCWTIIRKEFLRLLIRSDNAAK